MHGWGGVHPRVYGAWIQHVARKGHIVVFPRYQFEDKLRTPGDVMFAGAGTALQEAWRMLNEQGPVRPRADKIAWIGHSMGAVLSVKLAADAATLGLPPAGSLLLVQPGGHDVAPLGDLTALPLDTVVEIMTGDKDTVAGDSGARAIRDALSSTPGRRVELISMRSERRSRPKLNADHFAPLGVAAGFPPANIIGGDMDLPGGPLRDRLREARQDRFDVDALDYFGFWKVGDALLDSTFRGQNLEFGFGNTDQQRFMGTLSDGTPVIPLLVE
jgi:pimeloyl-ACP methyl ester carboxylesterase